MHRRFPTGRASVIGAAPAARIRSAVVAIEQTTYLGVTHEFFDVRALVTKVQQAVAQAAAGLRSSFGT